MIMKDVVISVTGIQQGPGGPETLELVTPGKYGVERDKALLTYEETELSGLKGTTTSFDVSPHVVSLKREGMLNTEMIFEEGKKNYFLYETPFGSLMMGLNTNSIQCRLNQHGGYMQIDYNVEVDNAIVRRNRFHVIVKEPEESHIGDIRWPI